MKDRSIVGFRGLIGGGMDYSGGIFEGEWRKMNGNKKWDGGSRVGGEVGVYVRM